MSTQIQIETVSEDLVAPYLELTGTYYHDEPVNDPAVVRWRHLENETGPSRAVELVDGDEHVGRMWIQIRPWSIDGRSFRAANPIDFLIREDHRRLPAFMSLFKATMAECEQHADLVFHTSNPLTDDLYRKLMKLKPVTELDGAFFPTRPFAAAQAVGVFRAGVVGRCVDVLFSWFVRGLGVLGRLGPVRFKRSATAAEQDAVTAAFESEESVCGSRSSTQRAWRFRGAGPIRYEVHWLSQRGQVVGYTVVSDRDLNGIRGRFVVDLVYPGSPSRIAVWSMWLQLAADCARDRRDALFLFYNRANPRLARLASLPLITVDPKRLPQRMPVFVRPSRARSSTPSPLGSVEWSGGYYVMSDFDLF
jgi:hypothetical protein